MRHLKYTHKIRLQQGDGHFVKFSPKDLELLKQHFETQWAIVDSGLLDTSVALARKWQKFVNRKITRGQRGSQTVRDVIEDHYLKRSLKDNDLTTNQLEYTQWIINQFVNNWYPRFPNIQELAPELLESVEFTLASEYVPHHRQIYDNFFQDGK